MFPLATRPPKAPVVQAFIQVLSGIELGPGNYVGVGDGEAPDCPYPYLVVATYPSTVFTGDMGRPDSDAKWRVSVVAVGITPHQASSLLDIARTHLTREAISAAIPPGSGYRVTRVVVDINRGDDREQRGLEEAIFSDVDIYEVYHTPAPSL